MQLIMHWLALMQIYDRQKLTDGVVLAYILTDRIHGRCEGCSRTLRGRAVDLSAFSGEAGSLSVVSKHLPRVTWNGGAGELLQLQFCLHVCLVAAVLAGNVRENVSQGVVLHTADGSLELR